MLLPTVTLLLIGLFALNGLAAPVAPDTVVAVINGRKVTAGELDRVLSGAPPKLAENLKQNRKMFAENYALLTMLREMAEKEGLAGKTPTREQLEWSRMQVLMQAAIAERGAQQNKAGAAESETGQDGLKKWLERNRSEIKVEIQNQGYFATGNAGDESKPVAVVDGKPLTGAEAKRIMTGLPLAVRQKFQTSPKDFLEQYALMLRLVADAEAQKLQEKSPYKEQLDWVQSEQLMQGKLNAYSDSITVGLEDEKAYYQSHLDDYTEAKVKVLYISFADNPAQVPATDGRKPLNEKEAREKIEGLRKQLQEGADFVKLVKENSEDATSASKDGDLGVIRRSDKLPDHIKKAIFALKPGDVSEPVKQPNGFYLFKLEQMETKTLDAVRQDLLRDAKTQKFQEWFDTIRKSATVTYENDAYFSGQGK